MKNLKNKNSIIPFSKYNTNEDIESYFSESNQTVDIMFNIRTEENVKFLETIGDVVEKYLEENGVYDHSEIKVRVI